MNKKKIGIVTFHTADNYGAVFQAYALQEYIRSYIEGEVWIIDFNTPYHESEHSVFKKAPDFIRSIVYNVFILLYYRPLKKRIKRFATFRHEFLRLTPHKYNSEQDFLSNMEPFDYYISGSDQVFNPHVRFSDCYFLGFNKGNGKKVAYAPSFGIVSFTKEENERIKELVSDFDALSCREKVGADYLSSITSRGILAVCDPVFLFTKKEWELIIRPVNHIKPYIFVYDLNGGYNLIDLARKVSAANGNLEIICATTSTRRFYKGVKVIRSLGPCEFLSYISSAACVVTDSFHGTSFSLILEKKVICYIALRYASSRIESLAASLNIQKQIVYDIHSFNWNNITFNDYRDCLNSFSKESQRYLCSVLQ